MNDLLSGRWFSGNVRNDLEGGGGKRKEAEMSPAADYNFEDEMNLRQFFEEVNEVKEQMGRVKEKLIEMRRRNEEAKAATTSESMKKVREAMAAAVAEVQRRAVAIKEKVDEIERGNAANRKIPGCGAGSASDRTRTAITAGLRKSLAAAAADVRAVRGKVETEYREAMERRYLAVKGKVAEEGMMVEGGAAVAAAAAVKEERREEAAAEVTEGLAKLQDMFMEMALLVADQGERLEDTEVNVGGAGSFVNSTGEDLHAAIRLQHNTRKWSCILSLVIAVVILIIIVPILIKFVPTSSS